MTTINPNVAVRIPAQLFTYPNSLRPIANGQIYIGKPDKDPVIKKNQINVYIENESGEFIPVSQPLSINSGGYCVYNGAVVEFYTDDAYSMVVYDVNNVQVYYYPNIMPASGAGKALATKHFLRVPEPSVEPLPNVDQRKHKLLGFDAYGDPVAIINQDHDYNLVEVAEIDPPNEDDELRYILLAGYKVPAYPTKLDRPAAAYPTVPRFVSPVYSFRATKNYHYSVPFSLLNAQFSELVVETDFEDRFSTLSVRKITQDSGIVDIVSSYSSGGDALSTISIVDKASRARLLLSVYHAYSPLNVLAKKSVKVNGKTVTIELSPTSLPQDVSTRYVSVVEPEISFEPKVNATLHLPVNYFHQALVSRRNQIFQNLVFDVVFDENVSGNIKILINEPIHGISVEVPVTIT
nr:MAG TPA: tail protein [Caudoviricetes sp.]